MRETLAPLLQLLLIVRMKEHAPEAEGMPRRMGPVPRAQGKEWPREREAHWRGRRPR
jgi:hypothetical protein